MVRELVSGLMSAVIVLIALGEASAAERCSAPPPALGHWQVAKTTASLPEQPWLDGDGKERRLADFAGHSGDKVAARPLIVNFWATWCAPCVKEMPALDRMSAAVGADGIKVLTLSADRGGAPVVRKFYSLNGLKNLPVAIDPKGRLARELGVPGLPTTVLFDARGKEVGRVVGVAEWDDDEAIAFLRRCLASSGGAG